MAENIIPNVNPKITPTATKPAIANAERTPKKSNGPIMEQRKIVAAQKSKMIVDTRFYGVKATDLAKFINTSIKPSPFNGIVFNQKMYHIADLTLKQVETIAENTKYIGFNLFKMNKLLSNISMGTDVLTSISSNTKKMSKSLEDKTDEQTQKDDPRRTMQFQQSEDTNKLLWEILQEGKKKKEAESGDIFDVLKLPALLAALTGIGGLLGFLLTGKGEFLNDLLKPFKIGFDAFKIGFKLIKGTADGIFKGIAKIGSAIFGGLIKNPIIAKLLGITGKEVGEIAAKEVGEAGGKAIVKGAGKVVAKKGAKIVGKVGLKLVAKIPGVGLVMGSAFAIDRAMRGDWTGAGLELLSGAASTLPGIGTAVSAGIDVGIVGRDIYRAVSGESKNDKPGAYETFIKGKTEPPKQITPPKTKEKIVSNIEQYDNLIEKAHKQYPNVPINLIKGLIAQESAGISTATSYKYDPRTKQYVYDVFGEKIPIARGLTQLIPETAAQYGVTNPYDPKQAILGGTAYLSDLLKMTGGDTTKAIAAYNAGPGALKQSRDDSTYSVWENPKNIGYQETREYVPKVKEKAEWFTDEPEKPTPIFSLLWKKIEDVIKSYKPPVSDMTNTKETNALLKSINEKIDIGNEIARKKKVTTTTMPQLGASSS